MASKWVEHVKEWSKMKEMKYNEAMKHPECKESYQKSKPDTDNGHKFEKEVNVEMQKTPVKRVLKSAMKKEVKEDKEEPVEVKVKPQKKTKKQQMNM